MEGETLAQKIRRRPLPLEEVLDLGMQIAEGLDAAHTRGIVHRDIKSANIMVTPEGRAKIMDFGLALLGEQTRITRAGSVLGTPAYMSPEQAQGRAADQRSDIWSAGVVLHEMLTGQLPFRGDNNYAMIRSIIEDEPAPLTLLTCARPAGIWNLWRR